MEAVPGAMLVWVLETTWVPRSRRAWSVPASLTETRARISRRFDVTFSTVRVGATVSPASSAVNGEAVFSSGGGPLSVTTGGAGDSHGRPGSSTAVASPALTAISPY